MIINKRIKIPKTDLKLCFEHANTTPEHIIDRYKSRGHHQKKRIQEQIFEGKIGEVATYYFLKNNDFPKIGYPQVEWTADEDNRFQPDIKSENGFFRFHIKTQRSDIARRFGLSWMFHSRDDVIAHPTDADILILTELERKSNSDYRVIIRHYLVAVAAVGIYSSPKKKSLKYKRCLYDEVIRSQMN